VSTFRYLPETATWPKVETPDKPGRSADTRPQARLGDAVTSQIVLAAVTGSVAALATAGGVALKGALDRASERRSSAREDRQRFFDALLLSAAEAFAMCDAMTRMIEDNPQLHFGSKEMYAESVRFHAAFATLHLLGDAPVIEAANQMHDLFDKRDPLGRVGYTRLEAALRDMRTAIRKNLGIDVAAAGHKRQEADSNPPRRSRFTFRRESRKARERSLAEMLERRNRDFAA
jgi:hypothetical protein